MVKYQRSCMRYSLRNTTENEFVAMLISLGFNKPKRQHVFLSKIPEEVANIMAYLISNGCKPYVVGG